MSNFNEVCVYRFFLASNPWSWRQDISSLLVQGEHLSHRSFISCFQKEKKKSEGPFCISYFSGAFSSKYPYVKVAYFGMACSATLNLCLLFPSIIPREISKKDTRIIKTFSGWILYTSIGKYSAGSEGKKMSKIVCFILFLSQEL